MVFDESDVQRRKVSEGVIEAWYASNENKNSGSEASGSMSKKCRNKETKDVEIPAQNDMVKVKGAWLQRREFLSRVKKEKDHGLVKKNMNMKWQFMKQVTFSLRKYLNAILHLVLVEIYQSQPQ